MAQPELRAPAARSGRSHFERVFVRRSRCAAHGDQTDTIPLEMFIVSGVQNADALRYVTW